MKESIIDGAKVTFPCPKCGTETQKTIGWIKANSDFVCACGQPFRLNSDEVRRDIERGIDRPLRDLEAAMKKFNKRK